MLMFLIINVFRDCENEEEVTRDYLEGIEAENDVNREKEFGFD